MWGLRLWTASSDGKDPSSEHKKVNHDRRGAVDGA